MLSNEQKESFFQLLQKANFKGFLKNSYVFHNGVKTSSIKVFYKTIQVPDCFEPYPNLMELDLRLSRGKVTTIGMNGLLMEYTRETLDESSPELTLNGTRVDSSEMKEYVASLVPAVNLSPNAPHTLILLDPANDNRPVMDVDPDIYLRISRTSEEEIIQSENTLLLFTDFDPYTLESLYEKPSKESGKMAWHVNFYNPPAWRFVEAEPRFDGFIKRLMDHLFPNKEELEYVLDWLHYAIVKRNDTVLCLIGPRGTGKGILLKDILGQLIGEKYREIVNQEILTDKFNGAFKNRRYIFFDEVNVSGDRELNKFKAFCNSHIALEEKGQDSETIDNYTSLALSSNDKKDFRAEPQERRFSVPGITDVPLLKVIPEEEIEEFISRISSPDSVEIAEFGHYLLQRKPKNSSRTPLKGKYYFELCKLSMPEWKTFIIDFFIHEGEKGVKVLNSILAKKFKKIHGEDAKYATKRGSVETFLLDYYHEGVCRLGRVVDAWDSQRARDTFAILPSDEFIDKFCKNEGGDSEEDIEAEFTSGFEGL